jgi:tellurite resistance protein TehA-like permease
MTAVEQFAQPVMAAHLSIRSLIREQVRTLDPAYFAMVMATGIVAIATHLTGMLLVGRVLAGIGLIAYVVLAVMTLARLVFFPREVFQDLVDHQIGFGSFALAAGTAVSGRQNVILFGMYRLGGVLWLVSFGMLLVIA